MQLPHRGHKWRSPILLIATSLACCLATASFAQVEHLQKESLELQQVDEKVPTQPQVVTPYIDPEAADKEANVQPQQIELAEEVKDLPESAKEEDSLEAANTKAKRQEEALAATLDTRFAEAENGSFYSRLASGRADEVLAREDVLEIHPYTILDNALYARPVIEFDLPNGKSVRLVRDYVTKRQKDQYTWHGHVEAQFGVAIFVVNGSMISGQFDIGNTQYKLVPLSENEHTLAVIDRLSYEDDETPAALKRMNEPMEADSENIPNDPIDKSQGNNARSSSAPGDCPVRLLVAYTDDVGAANADPVSEIQLATSYMNASNVYAGVQHEVEIARIMEVPYAEPSIGVYMPDVIDELVATNDGLLDEVHAARSLYDADIVIGIFNKVEVRNNRVVYGIANVIGPATRAEAFCTSVYDRMAGPLTFPHEIGHLYGARHDSSSDSTPGDNHGYFLNSSTLPPFKTVMATISSCTACPRLQFWSNPTVNYTGRPTGVVGDSDNERRLTNSFTQMQTLEPLETNKVVFSATTVEDREEGNFVGGLTLSTDIGDPLVYEDGSQGVLVAENSITLKPGFWAKSGTSVTAKLEGCNVASRPAFRGKVTAQQRLDVSEHTTLDFKVYPNPVRHGSSISVDFTLPEDGFSSLEVYSVDGRHLETVFYAPIKRAGDHHIEYQPANLPEGAYVAVLRTGSESLQKKFIVVQ